MKHSEILIQEAQRVIHYAESYVTLHCQMVNVFIMFYKFFLFCNVFNVLKIFLSHVFLHVFSHTECIHLKMYNNLTDAIHSTLYNTLGIE